MQTNCPELEPVNNMKHRSLLALSLLALATMVWATCDPGGSIPTCSAAGHPTVPDTTYSNPIDDQFYHCCNYNYLCESSNYGINYLKSATIYSSPSGQTCLDANGAKNYYDPVRPTCCPTVIGNPE